MDDRQYQQIADEIRRLSREVEVLRGGENQSERNWNYVASTATYASATSFTVSGDHTGIFKLGAKFRCLNSTVKYGYVLSSSYSAPNTTVNLVSNTSHALANAAITDVRLSYADPPDFPAYLNWTSTPTNFTTGNGSIAGLFRMASKNLVYVRLTVIMGSTSVMGTSPNFSLPIANVDEGTFTVLLRDPGVYNYVGMGFTSGGNVVPQKIAIVTYPVYSGVTATSPFTWADGDNILIVGVYGV